MSKVTTSQTSFFPEGAIPWAAPSLHSVAINLADKVLFIAYPSIDKVTPHVCTHGETPYIFDGESPEHFVLSKYKFDADNPGNSPKTSSTIVRKEFVWYMEARNMTEEQNNSLVEYIRVRESKRAASDNGSGPAPAPAGNKAKSK